MTVNLHIFVNILIAWFIAVPVMIQPVLHSTLLELLQKPTPLY